MLRHVMSGVIGALAGYVLGVLVGWLLVSFFSGNRHDKSTEAVMTAFFVAGPLLAIIGLIVGLVRSVRQV